MGLPSFFTVQLTDIWEVGKNINCEGKIQVWFPGLLQIFCENLTKSLKFSFRADWETNFTTMQNVKVQGGEKKKKKRLSLTRMNFGILHRNEIVWEWERQWPPIPLLLLSSLPVHGASSWSQSSEAIFQQVQLCLQRFPYCNLVKAQIKTHTHRASCSAWALLALQQLLWLFCIFGWHRASSSRLLTLGGPL